MYNNILVPIDFDNISRVEQTLAIADNLLMESGKVTLFHVVEEIPTYVSSQIPKDMLRNTVSSAEHQLKEIAKRLAKDADVVVAIGHSSRTILERAEITDVDCIILASHKPGLQDYFLGSTASHVVRHAKCSVHVIR